MTAMVSLTNICLNLRKEYIVKINQFFLSLTCASALALSSSAMANALSPDQVKQVQQVVHDYLVTNPQVLVEASDALQKQEMVKMEKNAKSAITSNAANIFADPASPVAGNPNGKVTIVEFFDYQCPHCKDMAKIVEDIIESDKQVRVVFKELPIFGASSKYASQVALAAYKQGADKYLQFHNALMAASNPLTSDKVMQIAKSEGLNMDQLKKDMNSNAVGQQIQNNFKLAQSLGIMGTPTFVIGKWEGNKASKTSFVPGATTEGNLQKLIKQAS
jgi:protein-disulfide isomerase